MEAYEPMIVALLGKTVQNLFFFTVKVFDATLGLVKKLTAGKRSQLKEHNIKVVVMRIFQKEPQLGSYLEMVNITPMLTSVVSLYREYTGNDVFRSCPPNFLQILLEKNTDRSL